MFNALQVLIVDTTSKKWVHYIKQANGTYTSTVIDDNLGILTFYDVSNKDVVHSDKLIITCQVSSSSPYMTAMYQMNDTTQQFTLVFQIIESMLNPIFPLKPVL